MEIKTIEGGREQLIAEGPSGEKSKLSFSKKVKEADQDTLRNSNLNPTTVPSSPLLGSDHISEDEEEEKTLEMKIDRLLNSIHGRGYFTCFQFFAQVLGMNCTGFYFYMLSYLTMPPQYKDCVYTDPQPEHPVEDCKYDNICKDDSNITDY